MIKITVEQDGVEIEVEDDGAQSRVHRNGIFMFSFPTFYSWHADQILTEALSRLESDAIEREQA